MTITIDTSDNMRIKLKKEEIKKIYAKYDKFVVYDYMMKLLETVGDMYDHIMNDEQEQGDDINDS